MGFYQIALLLEYLPTYWDFLRARSQVRIPREQVGCYNYGIPQQRRQITYLFT